MKLSIRENTELTKNEAIKFAFNLMNEAANLINAMLECDDELVAEVSKSYDNISIWVHTVSGQITPLGDFMFRNRNKITNKFYVTVKQSYGHTSFIAGFGSGQKTFGGGFNGTLQNIQDLDELNSFIMDTAVPKVITSVNKVYKFYKSKHK